MSGGRYRVITVRGAFVEPGCAVQVGGAGGRIIGEDWNLDRAKAEALAEELEAAHRAGIEELVAA